MIGNTNALTAPFIITDRQRVSGEIRSATGFEILPGFIPMIKCGIFMLQLDIEYYLPMLNRMEKSVSIICEPKADQTLDTHSDFNGWTDGQGNFTEYEGTAIISLIEVNGTYAIYGYAHTETIINGLPNDRPAEGSITIDVTAIGISSDNGEEYHIL